MHFMAGMTWQPAHERINLQIATIILDRRLKLFGHICQADPSHYHVWAL